MTSSYKLIIICIAIFWHTNIQGQTTCQYQHIIDTVNSDNIARKIFADSAGYVVFTDHESTSDSYFNLYKIKLNGALVSKKSYSQPNYSTVAAIRTHDNKFAILSFHSNPSTSNIDQVAISFFDNNLDSLYSLFNPLNGYRPSAISELSNNSFIISYNNLPGPSYSAFCIDTLGNILWNSLNAFSFTGEANSLIPDIDGNFLIGVGLASNCLRNGTLVGFDSTGNSNGNSIGNGANELCQGSTFNLAPDFSDILRTLDSCFIFSGVTSSCGQTSICHPDKDLLITKVTALGANSWSTSFPISLDQEVVKTIEIKNGYITMFFDQGYLKSAYIDKGGQLLFIDTISSLNFTSTSLPYNSDLTVSADGTIAYVYSDLINGVWKTFIKKIKYLSNQIKGRIVADLNTNCIYDSLDFKLSNIILEATPGPFFGVSDQNGNYTISTDTGTYIVRQLNNYKYFQNACSTNPQSINFNSPYQIIDSINFTNQPGQFCSNYWVDCGIGTTRRCFSNTISVKTCNEGSTVDSNLVLRVTLNDNYSQGLTSSLNLIQSVGNIYDYVLPPILPGSCMISNFQGTIKCSATLFSSNCIQAEILQDQQCGLFDTVFSIRQTVLLGACINDSSVFIIKNTNPNQTANLFYKLWINSAVEKIDTVSIAAGDSTTIRYYSGGATTRLQVFFYDFGSNQILDGKQITIEGCGQPFDVGYADQLPTNLYHDKIDEVCSVINGSLDPNDKSVQPTGIGIDHVVGKANTLTYKIRFQNTGNDTAFTVLIRDTISPNLDINSIYSGASSHNYQFNIYGNRIAEWYFENIQLPDSFVDEQNSQGFVDFEIKPMENIAASTMISNSAAIYFDYNDPVITNIVSNSICDTLTSSFSYSLSGPNVTLINTSLNPSTVLWSFGDGATDTTFNTAHQYSSNGTYEICLFTANDCDNKLSCQSINITGVGVSSPQVVGNLEIFPNPASDYLFLSNSISDISHTIFKIYSCTGNLIKEEKLENGILNIKDLKSQIYLLRYEINKNVYTSKFVVLK